MPKAAPLVINAFLGINNVTDADRLKAGELLSATNCDIDDTRGIRRRGGIATAPVAAIPAGAHSLFAPYGGAPDVCLFRHDDKLCRLMPDLSTVLVLKTGLAVGARMFYAAAPTRIFMSDGLWKGVTDGETVHDWGIAPPAAQPIATSSSGGRLPAGKYLFALTYLRADGEESGAGESGYIQIDGGGIQWSSVPVSPQADVTMKAMYLTKPNGKQLFRAFLMPNSATTGAYYGTTSDFRVKLETQFLRDPPPGRVLEHFNGRMLVGDGRFVWYNPTPYRYELFSPRAVTAHATNVTALAAVDDGVFVGTESKIDFHSGADYAATANIAFKAGYGACFGGVAYVEGARVSDGSIPGRAALLVTKRGIAVCGNGGVFRNLTETRYQYGAPGSVAAVARDMGGWTQLVAVMR